MVRGRILTTLVTLLVGLNWILSLKLTGTVIPYYGVLHREETLHCNFDLENDTLYAVKWYKDGHEFFRFKPRDIPQITIFPFDGVLINGSRSSLHEVQLDQITLKSKGNYRCEISAEFSFLTLDEEKFMQVMSLPQTGPKISGIYPWYSIGDNLTAYCNVSKSFPRAKLTWIVNSAQIEAFDCGCVDEMISESGELRSDGAVLYNSRSRLTVPIDSNYFRDGTLSIECRAGFPNSSVILQDVVTTNVKSGLGLQYAMQSHSTIPKLFHYTEILLYLIVFAL